MSMIANAGETRVDSLMSRTPLLGSLSRAIAQDVTIVFYLLAIVVTALVLAVKAFGLVALVISYLALVPLMFVFFIAITWP